MASKCNRGSECSRLAELSGVTSCLPWLAKATCGSAAPRMEKHLLLSLVANCWPGSMVLNWSIDFPNPLLRASAAGKFGRCLSVSVTPGRAEMPLVTVQVCLFLIVGCFEVASVIYRWERKFLPPDIHSASAVTEVVQPALGCWSLLVPSARSATRRGAWRCNYTFLWVILCRAWLFSESLGSTETVLMPKAVCCELHDLYLSKVIPALKINVWWRQTQNSCFVTPSPVSWTYWGGLYLLGRVFLCASN